MKVTRQAKGIDPLGGGPQGNTFGEIPTINQDPEGKGFCLGRGQNVEIKIAWGGMAKRKSPGARGTVGEREKGGGKHPPRNKSVNTFKMCTRG